MLKIINEKDFPQVFAIIEQSFPEDERRPLEEQQALFSEPRYSVYVLGEEKIKAFIACWEFEDFIFIEHFAVDKNFRNLGIGSLILNKFLSMQEKRVCLEVEPPETEIAKRRIDFYIRNGFFLNEYDYFQPPISKGKKAIPLMVMTSGEGISKEEFGHIRDVLYEEVYKYKSV